MAREVGEAPAKCVEAEGSTSAKAPHGCPVVCTAGSSTPSRRANHLAPRQSAIRRADSSGFCPGDETRGKTKHNPGPPAHMARAKLFQRTHTSRGNGTRMRVRRGGANEVLLLPSGRWCPGMVVLGRWQARRRGIGCYWNNFKSVT